jgi:hypothetical protein
MATGNVINNYPGGLDGQIQYKNGAQFAGTTNITWNQTFGSFVVNSYTWNNGVGSNTSVATIQFKDSLYNTTEKISGSISYVAGGAVQKPGIMISPHNLSYGNRPSRIDAGLGVWRSKQPGIYQRTQTTINGAGEGPSVHGVYIADGALDFFPDYASGNTAGLSYVILPASFATTTAYRYIGQISVNAYNVPGTPQWSLGWKVSDPLTPTWNGERTPGNRNIIWDSNNHVSINDANLVESFNVKGNIRIQATGANSGTGILFPDGTFQYTAASGSGGISNVTIKDEGNLVVSANTINFVGNGVTASNVAGVATITVPGGITGIAVQEEGTNVVASATSINFVGSSVTASNVGGVPTVTVATGGTIKVNNVSSNSINFGGGGVTTTTDANTGIANINIPGLAVQDKGNTVLNVSKTAINFVGAGVTARNVGNIATITIPGGSSGITVQDEGTNVLPLTTTVNFVGEGVTTSNVSNVATVTIPGARGAVIRDEGNTIMTSATVFNYVGPGITVSNVANVATITVSGISGAAAGNTTEIQFNDSGNFAATSNFAWAQNGLFVGGVPTSANASGIITARNEYRVGQWNTADLNNDKWGRFRIADAPSTGTFYGFAGDPDIVPPNRTVVITNEEQDIHQAMVLMDGVPYNTLSPNSEGTIFGVSATTDAGVAPSTGLENWSKLLNVTNKGNVKIGGSLVISPSYQIIPPANNTVGIYFADSTFQYTAAYPLTVQDEGSNVLTSTKTINFVGAGVTASNVANVATITIGGGVPAGSNTQIQFNDGGSFGADGYFTYNKSTRLLSLTGNANILLTANVGNLNVASTSNLNNVSNVTILGGTTGQVLTTNGSGNLSWTTIAAGGDTVYNKGNVVGTTLITLSDGTIQTCTMTGNTYFDISSVTSGKSITLVLTQGSGGNKLATYSGTVLWAVGYKTLSTAAGAVDMVNMVNIGGTYYATLTTGYAA